MPVTPPSWRRNNVCISHGVRPRAGSVRRVASQSQGRVAVFGQTVASARSHGPAVVVLVHLVENRLRTTHVQRVRGQQMRYVSTADRSNTVSAVRLRSPATFCPSGVSSRAVKNRPRRRPVHAVADVPVESLTAPGVRVPFLRGRVICATASRCFRQLCAPPDTPPLRCS